MIQREESESDKSVVGMEEFSFMETSTMQIQSKLQYEQIPDSES